MKLMQFSAGLAPTLAIAAFIGFAAPVPTHARTTAPRDDAPAAGSRRAAPAAAAPAASAKPAPPAVPACAAAVAASLKPTNTPPFPRSRRC